MTPITYLPQDFDCFAGIDVDGKSYSFTIKNHNCLSRSKKIPADYRKFYKYMQKNYPNKRIIYAYEAGPTGYSLHDYLRSKGEDCLVISPNAIEKTCNERVKNNRIDSEKISKQLKSGELKSIRVPEADYRELRHLVNTRKHYARKRKQAKQQIEALLLFENLKSHLKDYKDRWSARYIRALKDIPCSKAVRHRLNMLMDDLLYAREHILTAHHEIRTFCQNHPQINQYKHYLISIDGIGIVTATALLSRIGNPQYLQNHQEIGSFIGLTPRERSTGDTVRKGSITHYGDPYLRFLMIEAAWAAIRKNTELKQFFHRIKSRHHPNKGSKIAIVAVARKLTHRVYAVLKEQRAYRQYK